LGGLRRRFREGFSDLRLQSLSLSLTTGGTHISSATSVSFPLRLRRMPAQSFNNLLFPSLSFSFASTGAHCPDSLSGFFSCLRVRGPIFLWTPGDMLRHVVVFIARDVPDISIHLARPAIIASSDPPLRLLALTVQVLSRVESLHRPLPLLLLIWVPIHDTV
jgi:hypothetical protein